MAFVSVSNGLCNLFIIKYLVCCEDPFSQSGILITSEIYNHFNWLSLVRSIETLFSLYLLEFRNNHLSYSECGTKNGPEDRLDIGR